VGYGIPPPRGGRSGRAIRAGGTRISIYIHWRCDVEKKKQDGIVVWNIGYQGRSLEEFIQVLRDAGVTMLVDLREKPFSRIKGFSRNVLRAALARAGIAYKGMGANLGGLTCTPDLWKQGCQELARLTESHAVAIMCMERDASKCHRRKLVEILQSEHGIASVPL
jgi:uncharacterized protein (DUF488 family)